MRKYRNYTEEDIVVNAKQVFSMAQLLKNLNLRPTGGNYFNMGRKILSLKIDISHWTKQGWNSGKQLKNLSNYKKANRAKPHLIQLRGHRCEVCFLDIWMNQPIPLELHHLDGNRSNNSEDNLQIVCCNCHAQTDNWRNRKRLVGVEGLEPSIS